MNSEIIIHYENDQPVETNALKITNSALHSHPDTIEVIYVMEGEVEVKVSFEKFALSSGDFLIVNHGDFHYIRGNGNDNAVLSIFIDLSWLEERIRHIRYITFACESFLIKDNRVEYIENVRNLIQSIALDLALKRDGYKTCSMEKVLQMTTIMVDHFTILQYYSNEQKLNSQKLEKYYSIMKKIEEEYQNKSLLDQISKSVNYSKFYLAHLYKGMMMMSIQDSLSAMRCFQSEKLLLTTGKSIQEIALECGFSDAKYYYKHFHKWYDCTPAQYRKQYQVEINKENIFEEIILTKLLILLKEEGLKTAGGKEETTVLAVESESFYFAAANLFGKSLFADDKMRDAYAINWNIVDATIRNMLEKGFTPLVEMYFNSRTADDWFSILKTCYKLYETEIGDWQFCFHYIASDDKENLQNLISEIRKACPRYRINAVLLWNIDRCRIKS